jgi:hypothetical protein
MIGHSKLNSLSIYTCRPLSFVTGTVITATIAEGRQQVPCISAAINKEISTYILSLFRFSKLVACMLVRIGDNKFN